MESKFLDVKYKGHRNYVHGTDIIASLTKLIRENYGICNLKEIKFNKSIIGYPLVKFGKVSSLDSGNKCASGQFFVDTEQVDFVISDTSLLITERYDYDEEKVTEGFYLDLLGNEISMYKSTRYSSIETLVALNKILCIKLLGKSESPWMFGRLRLSLALKEDGFQLKIKIRKMIAGKFVVSEFFVDDIKIGEIEFIRR